MRRTSSLPALGVVLLTTTALTLSSCGSDPTSPSAAAAIVVEFGADEIDVPAALPTGLVTFTVRSSTAADEPQIQLLRVDDDADPASLFAAMAAGDFPGVLELSQPAGGINLDPGGSTDLVVELDPARYVFLDPDSGNVSELLDASGGSEAVSVSIDGAVSMEDFAIGLPVDFGNGTYSLDVTDESIHGLTLVELDDDVTLAQIQALLVADADLPGTEVVRAGNLGPGTRQVLTLDLPAGHYVAASYFPDFETGSTQAAQGMVAEFTVEG